METKLAPLAFRHAETTRAAGLALMRGLALVSAAAAALMVVVLQVAIGMPGGGARYLAGLVTAAALGGYAAAGPALFAHVSRAATASVAGRRLAALALLHVAGWALVVLAVHG